jgi:U3 small nucleolar RNA-associated protein 10
VEVLKESRILALLHSAAFLEAHILEDDGIDFQTILPLLLVALQDPDAQIRQGALECISRIRILSDRKLSSVYRFDTVYGDSEREQSSFSIYLPQLFILRPQGHFNIWNRRIRNNI